MEQLLKALQAGNEDLVVRLASDLFITGGGEFNHAQINEFERFAPCKITTKTVMVLGHAVNGGMINYNARHFYFG